MNLRKLRDEIDSIDQQILMLLNKRANLALKIKNLIPKKSNIRIEREQEIIENLTNKESVLDKNSIVKIFTEIIGANRKLQNKKPISVATLGPKGTYSEEAVRKLFGSTVEIELTDTISDALSLAETQAVDIVVAPLENSSEGVVRESHDFLYNTQLNICAELWLPISHCLLTNATSLKDIKRVYAHPQALGQCRRWLAKNLPHAQQIRTSSNSEAAKKARRQKNTAAIASAYAGEVYSLPVKYKKINDQSTNRTRFIALSNQTTQPTGRDKTSIVAIVHEKPGALFELLKILNDAKITMTRLESQPYPHNQYAFFIDFVGHIENPKVKNAMQKLKREAAQIIFLGSYREASK